MRINKKLPLTPLTDKTFIRQGWKKYVFDFNNDSHEALQDADVTYKSDYEYYYLIPLPKDSGDPYPPCLVTTTNKDYEFCKELGLKPNTFAVQLLDTDGIGLCKNEEELEILYRALTREEIE